MGWPSSSAHSRSSSSAPDRSWPPQGPRPDADRNRARARPRDRGHGFRRRAHLGWTLQSRGHARVSGHSTVGAAPRCRLLGRTVRAGAGVAVELILTFFLVWVIFATAADSRGTFKSIAGLAIGFTITLDILMGGPLTGAAMNPARAFGPELVQNFWGAAWIYYVGPALGAVAAAMLYELLYLRPWRPSRSVPRRPASASRDRARQRRASF